MPFMSDAQLAKLRNVYANQKKQISNLKKKNKVQEKAEEFKSTLECVGAAAGMGFLRGKREDAAGVWNAPFVKFDMELLVGLAFVGSAFFDILGKYDEDALNMGNGVLSHYAGQVMRKMAKTGTFSQVAGNPIFGALPQYDPTSYDPTQIASPHADPVAAALSRSGV